MSGLLSKPPRLFAIAALLSAAGVGAALVSQHVYGMEPCPWCVLQRLIFVLIALVALVGLAWRAKAGAISSAILMDLLATCGVAAALWQHFVAAASQSCNRTLADKILNGLGLDGALPEIFAPRASCADAAVKLFGVPYEFWSLALFVVIGALAMLVLLSVLSRRRTA
jgi:disulfide bond formation protein DsbB